MIEIEVNSEGLGHHRLHYAMLWFPVNPLRSQHSTSAVSIPSMGTFCPPFLIHWTHAHHLSGSSPRYTTGHIWACPPSEGDDYIFHCHPVDQKIPKPKRLQEWYKKMLDKAVAERIVHDYKVCAVSSALFVFYWPCGVSHHPSKSPERESYPWLTPQSGGANVLMSALFVATVFSAHTCACALQSVCQSGWCLYTLIPLLVLNLVSESAYLNQTNIETVQPIV